jgi:putative thiamine transport system ATP-binding protein
MNGPSGNGLELRDVSISVGDRALVRGLSLTIAPGEVQTLMGPSGVGKSSLISFIAGALPAGFSADGDVVLNTRRLNGMPIEARRIGVLYQDDLLFAHMSVGDNLAFALPANYRKAERAQRVLATLREAELEDFAPRDPATLSGGQKARVSLMRALLAEPEALLLDEPFSKFDDALRERMRNFTFRQIRERKLPALLVTHDPSDAPGAVHRLA